MDTIERAWLINRVKILKQSAEAKLALHSTKRTWTNGFEDACDDVLEILQNRIFDPLEWEGAPEQDALEIKNIWQGLPTHPWKKYPTRELEQIEQIVIHHTAGPENQEILAIAKYHIAKNDWPGIAYHYMVNRAGDVYKVNPLTNISYHAKGANTKSLGICFIGDYTGAAPPDKAVASVTALIKQLKAAMPSIKRVLPHYEVDGSSTACPGKSFPRRLLHEWNL